MDYLKIYKKEEIKLLIGYLFVLAIQIALILIYRKAEITFTFDDESLNSLLNTLPDMAEIMELEKEFPFLVGHLGIPMSFASLITKMNIKYIILGLDIVTLIALFPFDLFAFVFSKGMKRYEKTLKMNKTGIIIAIVIIAYLLLTAFTEKDIMMSGMSEVENLLGVQLGELTFHFNIFGYVYCGLLILQIICMVKLSDKAQCYANFKRREIEKAKQGEVNNEN